MPSLVVGAVSDLLQSQWGVNEGDSLRYAMIMASATVMSLGTYFVYRASRTAGDDAQRVLASFIAQQTDGAPNTATLDENTQ